MLPTTAAETHRAILAIEDEELDYQMRGEWTPAKLADRKSALIAHFLTFDDAEQTAAVRG